MLRVLVVSLLVVVLDNTVLNIALPTIQKDLSASASELIWAVDAYQLVFAALLFTWGVLGDRYGRKRILMIGLTLFAIASAICAFSVNAGMLIAFRAIMGIGGAAVLPVTLAIITVVFPRHERGRAIGLWAAAVGGAVALGPVLGGLLLQYPQWTNWLTGNDWGSVFLINVPIVAVGLVGIWRVVPETLNPNPQRIDLLGLLLSIIGLVSLVYGIIHVSETLKWGVASVIVPIVFGLAVLAVFVINEARSDHKSFDVSLFKNRGFSVSIAAVSLAFFALSGVTFSLPFYLQILRGYTTLQAGLLFVPFAVGQFLGAPRSAAMVARFGYRAVITTGLLIVAVALFSLTRLQLDTPVWVMVIMFFLFGFGMGNVIAPASTVVQNVLPLPRVGAGSAVQNTVRQVFGAFGVAVIGTVLATRYADKVTGALAPLPPDVREGVKTSVQLTQQALVKAPPVVAEKIRPVAFDAFLTASHITYWISTGVIVLAAAVVLFLLPHITPPTAHPEGDAPAEAPRDAAAQEVEADDEASVVPVAEDEAQIALGDGVPGRAVPETS
jgi:EmrB/QacA subfamily drug resistance transporter